MAIFCFLRLPTMKTVVFVLRELDLVVALLLIFLLHANSQIADDYGSLRVDCGYTFDYAYDDERNLTWLADVNRNFIKPGCGICHVLNDTIKGSPMNTLRFFPDQNKNCYTLPAFIGQKYLIRVGFNYGNYDGLSSPPTFDLQLDATAWTTVVTSLKGPVFHEAVVVTRYHNVSVCVARTHEQAPFMSSLELVQLLPGTYSNMQTNWALFKQHRVNYGSKETVRYPDDRYDRIWDPARPSDLPTNYTNLLADFQSLLSPAPNDPPLSAIRTAIQAALPSDQLVLEYELEDVFNSIYISLYFAEVSKLTPGQNRTFGINLDDRNIMNGFSPVYQTCSEIHATVDPSRDILLTLSPNLSSSNLPPILNAIELYTVKETLEGTAKEDVLGLEQLSQTSDSLSRWSGDPCLPVAWEWVTCDIEAKPPRVVAMYASNRGIPWLFDFSPMQALKIIDLHNNSLSYIPDFFANFPNLQTLNLADNGLIGTVPEYLINENIRLNISGNPNLEMPSKKKNSGTWIEVGLSIAGVSVLLGIMAVFLHRRRRKDDGTIELGQVPRDH